VKKEVKGRQARVHLHLREFDSLVAVKGAG
jgi:hypothetical protein